MDVKKLGIVGVLAAMMLGVVNEGRIQIMSNAMAIARMQEREKSIAKAIEELHEDVKWIKRKMHGD